jgi:hypothetical protein
MSGQLLAAVAILNVAGAILFGSAMHQLGKGATSDMKLVVTGIFLPS